MIKLSSLRSIIKSYLSIFLVFFAVLLSIQSSTALVFETHTENGHSGQVIDLYLSNRISVPVTTYQRLVILSSDSWDLLLLKILVQNYGESLDSVLVSVMCNGILTEKKFNSYEQSGSNLNLVHQFEQVQELTIPLNISKEKNISLTTSITLDPAISWRESIYNFSINSASLHSLNLIQPRDFQPLPVFSPSHTFIVQPNKLSFFNKKILTKCLIPVSIPERMELNALVNVKITGASFDHLSLDSEIKEVRGKNNVNINTTVDKEKLSGNIWSLLVYITPLLSSNNDPISLTISVDIHGKLKPHFDYYSENFLSMHPVPIPVMIIILIIVLYVVPYYFVYQEKMVDKKIEF
ncbi:MAG: hypothetical protein ACXAC6_07790 [Candidatus Hodarchaeales archaeon]|jgi:hypothetical protein